MPSNFKLLTLTVAVFAIVISIAGCTRPQEMSVTKINSTAWSEGVLDQGWVVDGARRTLVMSGQVSLEPDANAPFGVVAKHPNVMRSQFEEALAGVDTVLQEAGMTRDDVIHMRFFVTDMDAALANYDVFLNWMGENGNRPPQTLIGISALFLPDLMIEIEATAAD